ncbi:MAG: hypothetical protein KZQ99_05820 [Candidatus Thiodiazotropha sp. (ex Dulcina madagascariensis)]|nr:hypothetical protein [Candidatus Thiodiazotropha sp. (ex Dulcina madagascariensis)]
MTRTVWPIFCGSILIIAHLHAAEPTYASPNYESRRFGVNPGNMMGGMMNPMHNLFGNSANRGGYNDYRYAYPAPPGYPPGYAYPGVPYGQPPVYDYGGAAPAPAYSSTPYQYRPQTPPAAPAPSNPAPAGSDNNRSNTPEPLSVTPGYHSSLQKRYRFRPLDNTQPTPAASPMTETPPRPMADETSMPSPVTQAPPLPASNPTDAEYSQRTQPPMGYPSQPPATRYAPQTGTDAGMPQEQTMKFRPWDKPGYSQ